MLIQHEACDQQIQLDWGNVFFSAKLPPACAEFVLRRKLQNGNWKELTDDDYTTSTPFSHYDDDDTASINSLPKSLLEWNDGKDEKVYKPKRSTRISKSRLEKPHDGDTWVEHIVVANKQTGRTRSYYRSKKTGKKYWDEPLSGASQIILSSRSFPHQTRHRR